MARQWQAHRVLRPEAYGGLVNFVKAGLLDVPLPSSIIDNTVSRDRHAIVILVGLAMYTL